MDIWLIGNKAALLFYVITATFSVSSVGNEWNLLAYLGYVSLNIATPIFRKKRPKQVLALSSAVFLIGCAVQLDALYLLLLPINLYELAAFHPTAKRYSLLLMLIPALFVPTTLLPLLISTAFLSYLLHTSVGFYAVKLEREENEREHMSTDLQKLTRSLHENSQYLRQSEYTIKLEERNRLSQQIHDEVGHSMAGALIQMEAARRLLAIDRDKASELLQNAIKISQEGLESIRLTLKDMKPKPEELGINRLRLFVDELSSNRSVQATLSHSGDLDAITPIQWKIIQENATEAVTNSFKYGGASSIHFEIQVLNRFVKAVVTDNGRGAQKVVKGLGILGMEERAATLGGTVVVDGTGGFRVTTLLPREDSHG